ncbi:hypothetical protein PTSG_10663 [Salpingoeca rosetta]|uniref:ABC-2 type transporter transmembrane domain-containing protein n=1 Tax=Salpingoeca rosetta (strain ATCC 50818 / BSB-021) TaxID=946362 RepID=F2UQ10_SALR5|nr:uncharacterized protein PTSG_10663 [Salpingoeca rosetta]EGD79678.1 hypothetical protein PTSG_10663 [Salpingoeca rosetta]|eukprot:XP_004988628.1 hypothetical protein PTSG_10663 [Salpingoeca rosetta]
MPRCSAWMTVYFGRTDAVVSYFDSLGDAFKCPPYFNPAEHIQRLAFAFHGGEGGGKSDELMIRFEESQHNTDLIANAKRLDAAATRRESRITAMASASVPQQFWWLCWRNARLFYRNKLKTKVKLMINIVLGVILGVIYFDVPNSYTGISDRNFFMLQLAVVVGVRQSMETLSFFLREKVVYLRQVEQGLYGVFPYLTSRFIVELPQMVFFPLVFCSIALPLVDLNYGGGNFFIFWAALVFLILNAYSFGLAIGTIITDAQILSVVAPMVVFPFLIFSGLTAVNIPPAINWLQNIIYLRYGMLAILQTEYEGQEFYQGCTREQYRNGSDVCTIVSGDQVLEEFDMKFITVGEAFAIMAGLFVVAFGIAIFCLTRLSSKRQG